MIHCEFRKINSASEAADTRLAQFTLPAVPSRGELINIDGNPYIVFERAWAVGNDPSLLQEDRTIDEMWCYLRVVPHHR